MQTIVSYPIWYGNLITLQFASQYSCYCNNWHFIYVSTSIFPAEAQFIYLQEELLHFYRILASTHNAWVISGQVTSMGQPCIPLQLSLKSMELVIPSRFVSWKNTLYKYRMVRRPISRFIGWGCWYCATWSGAQYQQPKPINLDIGRLAILYLLYISSKLLMTYIYKVTLF